MKVMVIGAKGQLGYDLCRSLCSFDLVKLTHNQIDVGVLDSVKQALTASRPDVVINTAANLTMDDSESCFDELFRINTIGSKNVAQISQDIGAKVIYISTDYVFGGGPAHRDTPYSEVDEAIPINNYGKTKLAGERMVATFCKNYLIIRASGFFGIAGKNSQKGNFVDKIITLSRERGEVKVVNDQIFSPTYTKHLANKIRDLIATDSNGIIHVTNKGECSWWKFAQTIVDLSGAKAVVVPIRSEDYPTRAKRPSYSVLAHLGLRILGLDDLKPWEEALKEYMFEQGYIG